MTSCRTEIEAELSAGLCGNYVKAELTAAIDTCVEDVQVKEITNDTGHNKTCAIKYLQKSIFVYLGLQSI